MGNRFEKERIQLALLLLFAAMLGGTFGYWLEFVLVALIGYLFYFIRKTEQFFRWLKSGSKKELMKQEGLWGDIVAHLESNNRRQKRARIRYKEALNRVNKLTDGLQQGVIILRRDYCLEWWNEAAAELIGLKKQDGGSPVTNLMRVPDFVSFILQKHYPESLQITSPINNLIWLQISAARVDEDDIVLVIDNVSHLHNLEQMRKDFVANVSHELRTPLTVLKGYSETLPMLAPDNKKLTKVFKQVNAQVSRMQGLADDLLLLAKIENDSEPAREEKLKLAKLLKVVVADAEDLSQGLHRISLKCDSGLRLTGSKTELYGLFSNLVFNAVRHNPEGAEIRIQVSTNKHWCQVEVSDNGVGFDPVHIPRLTERFYRIDSSRNSDIGGTGLGLAIVKHVLQRHRAQLFINAHEGKGASFSCKFPLGK